MTDFETAMRNALRSLMPGVPANGCWFHFCQAVRRKAASITDFMKFLKTNRGAFVTFKKFYYLPLLPEGKIAEGFEILVNNAKDTPHPAFTTFIMYFRREWMLKV